MTYPPPYEQQPGAQPTQPVPPTPSSSPPTTPYPSYLGPPTPPGRPRSNGPILAVVIALAVLLVGGSVAAGVLLVSRDDDPGKVTVDPTRNLETPQVEETTPEPAPTESGSDDAGSGDGAKVVYEVTGSGSANVIYFKSDGITPVQAGETDLPWRQELRLESDAAFVSVNATRASGEGELGCRITIDGKEVAKKSASGQYAIVLCSKLVL
jgi:hypothetical protein